ncbi:hypothetical protein LCGC14_2668880 [marine sediment metagenome]|uniref:Uncharacterized protein n=1 Tax=marine sediment metagenome TaxID=412755 RepID=A0A0F9AC34_9ZZZZ
MGLIGEANSGHYRICEHIWVATSDAASTTTVYYICAKCGEPYA